MNIFNIWNTIKQITHKNTYNVFFKERDVFFIHIGKNIGFEQNGKGEQFLRPVVVLRKFNNSLFWGIPLTTNTKKGKYYFSFQLNNKTQNAIISQMRLFDAKRLGKKLGMISNDDYQSLLKNTSNILLNN